MTKLQTAIYNKFPEYWDKPARELMKKLAYQVKNENLFAFKFKLEYCGEVFNISGIYENFPDKGYDYADCFITNEDESERASHHEENADPRKTLKQFTDRYIHFLVLYYKIERARRAEKKLFKKEA